MLWQQKRTQLPILNMDFAIEQENKTQTQQTKYSVKGIFYSNLDLNSAGEKGLYYFAKRNETRRDITKLKE